MWSILNPVNDSIFQQVEEKSMEALKDTFLLPSLKR